VARSAFSVLAIDGGGIRGIIPARILQAIEERTQRPIAELFDLVAGTSTGGIIALGLTKPNDDSRPQYSATELLELYTKHGREIFDKSTWHTVGSIGGLLHERYSVKALDRLLKERFGDTMLSEATVEVVVPTYDLTRPGPFFFKRLYARNQDKDWDLPFWQAARATSAAPTYFEPMALPRFADDPPDWDHALVDGGVFANNPAACAYAEALEVFTAKGDNRPIEIHVVSLGTGTPPQRPGEIGSPVPYERARGWGLAEWAAPMLHVVFDGVSKTVDHQMQLLCRDVEGSPPHYHRIQGELAEASPAMDDASDHNVQGLLADAERILTDDENKKQLDEACAALATIAAQRDQHAPTP
jgi:predicted acylesterase/phospholipase RssA